MKIFVVASVALSLVGCTSAALLPARDASEPAVAEAALSVADLAEGAPAPDFVALGHDGNNVALSALRGRTVVLFFYTRDETPSAIREAIGFRDAWPELQRQGVVVVGVSTDPAETHKPFAERLRLPFSLVADTQGAVARAYGVPAQYGVADRRTFVIGPAGTIEKVYRTVDVESHAAQVLELVGE